MFEYHTVGVKEIKVDKCENYTMIRLINSNGLEDLISLTNDQMDSIIAQLQK